MDIRIRRAGVGAPAGKLADAEVHFGLGVQAALKLVDHPWGAVGTGKVTHLVPARCRNARPAHRHCPRNHEKNYSGIAILAWVPDRADAAADRAGQADARTRPQSRSAGASADER